LFSFLLPISEYFFFLSFVQDKEAEKSKRKGTANVQQEDLLPGSDYNISGLEVVQLASTVVHKINGSFGLIGKTSSTFSLILSEVKHQLLSLLI